jgi:hypothetical protein
MAQNLIDKYYQKLMPGISNLANTVSAPFRIGGEAVGFAALKMGQDIGNYVKGNVVQPIQSGIKQVQQPGALNKALGVAQIVSAPLQMTPGAAGFNAGYAGLVGTLSGIRNKNPYQGLTAAQTAFNQPTSLSQAGLGMKPGLLSTAIDLAVPLALGHVTGKVSTAMALDRGAVLENPIAKEVAQLANKFNREGNISVQETDKIIQLAKSNLKIPEKTLATMNTGDILRELQGTFTGNQKYMFQKLPGMGFAEQKPENPYLAKISNPLETSPTNQIPKTPQQLSPGTPPLPPTVRNPTESLAESIARPGMKERQFVTTVKESANTAPEVKQMVEGYYVPKSNDVLSRSARSQINTNIDAARQKALTGLDDESVAIANELINHYSSAKDYESAAYIANTAAENLTSHGRAVQAASLYDKLTPEGVQRFAASQLQKVKMQLKPEDAKRLFDKAKVIQEMPAGTPKAMAQQKLLEEVQNLIPSPLVNKLITIWKAGLLTGLKTTGRNVVSNAINEVSEITKDAPATVTDMIASLFTGKRTKTFTVSGTGEGFSEGVRKGFQYLKTGFDERRQVGKLDVHHISWGESALGQAARKYTDTVFRFLGAQDQPFYYSALKRSLYDQAGAEAINAGKGGNVDFIENLIKNPTDSMIKTSVLDAERAVYQQKTALGTAISNAKEATRKVSPEGGAILDFVAPFTGVPSAVASQAMSYGPLGIANTIISNIGKGKFDQRQFSEGIGRGLTGSLVIAMGYNLMKKGLMTLDSPKTEKERQRWDLEGKKPFSVLVNGEWRQIGSLGPEATAMSIGGYLQNGGTMAALVGGLKQQKEQTYLKGISSLSDAIDNPQGYAKGYFQSSVSGTVPTLVGDVAKAIDPSQRETNTIPESVKAKIPVVRQGLLPKRNALGDVMPNDQGVIGSMIDIFNSTPAKSAPVIDELRRLDTAGFSITPSKIDPVQTIGGGKVTFTPQVQNQLETKSGQVVKDAWTELLKSPQYQALDDEQKSKVMQSMLEDVRTVEKIRVAAQNGLAPEQVAMAITKLTKDQRAYLTTGKVQINIPKEQKQILLDQNTIQNINSALQTGASPLNFVPGTVGSIKKITAVKSGGARIKKIKMPKLPKPKKFKVRKIKTVKIKKVKTPKLTLR